ncbi:hypothetical protein [Pedomonas mirosovicensis]|uniref:hypothetical protein n=1 Tax=Pedomonas mirosovicensis TaxID=2908641 RepID=UPI0021680A2C|nr:hypothetical protein [Pedomonas mirosovicensis]MCH8684740.1 hypothetical protein [Pedomonas mirosovicensis]
MKPLFLAVVSLGLAFPALAQDLPPQGARPLSEIAASIENRDDFVAFVKIEYAKEGYKIRYRTRSGDEREILVDPLSGSERKKDQ